MDSEPQGGDRPASGGTRAHRVALAGVLAAAIAGALLHLAPYWHAEATTPAGWEFTGNLHSSPDFMQYRLWMRQSADEGALVTDRLTAEPHRPFLPVVFYQMLGGLARRTGADPEWTSAYVGATLVAGLVLLLYATLRRFVSERHFRGWILGALLVGGGLGAHLKFGKALVGSLMEGDARAAVPLGSLASPTSGWALIEDYRGHYLFATLFDTHYLMIWIAALAAILIWQRALEAPSARRTLLAALAFAAATALHVYLGPMLIAIAWAVVALGAAAGRVGRRALVDAAIVTAAASAVLAGFFVLLLRSGLPMPAWRGTPIPLSVLLVAHPVAWGLIARGLPDYWRAAGPRERFLLGWALACTLLVLSAPFYPYADRAAVTLQVPLYLIASTIYFRRWGRVTPRALVVAVLIMGVSPIWIFQTLWRAGEFSPHAPHKWLSTSAGDTIEALRRHASADDVLFAEPSQARWLAPEHPGRHYVAHFFLTVDFDSKAAQYERFCAEAGPGRVEFLRSEGIRFVHLLERCAPWEPSDAAQLRLLHRDEIGTLYELPPAARS